MIEKLLQIPIKINNEINPAFIKATSDVLFKNQQKFKCNDPIINNVNLKNIWEKTFHAELIKKDSKNWTHIQFKTSGEMFLFLIKYGK